MHGLSDGLSDVGWCVIHTERVRVKARGPYELRRDGARVYVSSQRPVQARDSVRAMIAELLSHRAAQDIPARSIAQDIVFHGTKMPLGGP